MKDIAVDNLEIVIRDDGKVVWLNTEKCVFRAYVIKKLTVDDRRKPIKSTTKTSMRVKKYDDIRIRKVKVLCDVARETARQMKLKDDDLVIVKTYLHPYAGWPTYELEKIEGSPIEYLQRKLINAGPFSLDDVDLYLDDMCDLCSEYYCKKLCEHKGVKRLCGFDTVEECPKIPCLDCSVYEVRKQFEMEIAGTVGRRGT